MLADDSVGRADQHHDQNQPVEELADALAHPVDHARQRQERRHGIPPGNVGGVQCPGALKGLHDATTPLSARTGAKSNPA